VGKFINILKQIIFNESDKSSEESIKEIQALNQKIRDITIDGENGWHLCWSDKKDNTEIRSKHV